MFFRMRNVAKRVRETSLDSPCTPTTSPPTSPSMMGKLDDTMMVDSCGNSAIGQSDDPSSRVDHKADVSQVNIAHSHISRPEDADPDNLDLIHHISSSIRRKHFSEGNQIKLFYSLLDPKTKFDQRHCDVAAVAFNSDGHIMVADAANCNVKAFDALGQLKVEYTIPSNYGNLVEPAGLCTMSSGEIVVADKAAGDLKVFRPDGQFMTKFGKDLKSPCDVTANSHGHVIVVEEGTRKIHIYKRLGNEGAVVLSGEVEGHTMMDGPRSVGVSNAGHIVVSDPTSKAIILYDCFGKFLSIYKGEDNVTTRGCARRPKSLCSSYSLGRLQVPHGVANDHHGNVYVIDSAACRVARFDLIKNAFTEEVITRDHGLVKPCRLAASSEGHVAVTEEGSSIIKIFTIGTD